MKLAVVTAKHCYLRKTAGCSEVQNDSGIEDEIFSGWAVRLLPGTQENGWVKVETHYGYQGFVRKSELRCIEMPELQARQDKSRFFRLGVAEADLLDQPKVQGLPMEPILKNAFVELLKREADGDWVLVRTAAGREGYTHACYLCERADDDGYLLACAAAAAARPVCTEDSCQDESAPGGAGAAAEQSVCAEDKCQGRNVTEDVSVSAGQPACMDNSEEERIRAAVSGYFLRRFAKQRCDEAALRESVTRSAMAYLGTQYRWGGKSSQGLDCSGLVFMSYLENGVLIYRDAAVRPEYPARAISREELQPGDMIFFPGHVAMYLGGGRYIHSTAYAKNAGVTINSLNPEDADYREDLAGKITGCGSVFAGAEARRIVCEPDNRRNMYTSATGAENRPDPSAGSLQAAFKWDALRARLDVFPGKVSMVYRELVPGGRTFYYHAEQPHIAASVIKLFLMAAVFQGFEDGRFKPSDRIRIRRENCVPSCGVLNYLQEELEVTVRDLVELMIIVSDNTATNALFDFVGEEYLGAFIRERLGLSQTSFNRKMFDSVRAAQGIENYVTGADVAWLLEEIYYGRLVSEDASRQMYEILTHQRLNGKIPFCLHTLPNAPVIAHKTGEDSGITHDVGIIAGRTPFILCFLGSETDVPRYERLMAETALELYCAVNR